MSREQIVQADQQKVDDLNTSLDMVKTSLSLSNLSEIVKKSNKLNQNKKNEIISELDELKKITSLENKPVDQLFSEVKKYRETVEKFQTLLINHKLDVLDQVVEETGKSKVRVLQYDIGQLHTKLKTLETHAEDKVKKKSWVKWFLKIKVAGWASGFWGWISGKNKKKSNSSVELQKTTTYASNTSIDTTVDTTQVDESTVVDSPKVEDKNIEVELADETEIADVAQETSDEEVDASLGVGTTIGGVVAGGGAGYGLSKIIITPEFTKKGFSPEHFKASCSNMKEQLLTMQSNGNLSGTQGKYYDGVIKQIDEFSKQSDSAVKGLNARKSLKHSFPQELLKDLPINSSSKKFLSSLSKVDFEELLVLKKKFSGDELLKQRQIHLRNAKGLDIPDAKVLSLVASAEDLNGFKNINTLLSNLDEVKGAGKFIGVIGGVGGFALDLWMANSARKSSKKEIERLIAYNTARAQNKINQSNFNYNLALGGAGLEIAFAGAEVAAILLGSGPPGWVGLAIGVGVSASIAGVTYAADQVYFNVMDFYQQNFTDYRNQYRTEIKQGIMQLAYSASGEDLSFNEDTTQWINDNLTGTEVDKFDGMKKAWTALLYQEEIGKLEDNGWKMTGQEEQLGFIKKFHDSGLSKKQFENHLEDLVQKKTKEKIELGKEKDNENTQKIAKIDEEILELDKGLNTFRRQWKILFVPILKRLEYIDQKYLKSDDEGYTDLIDKIKDADGIDKVENILAESRQHQMMSDSEYVSGATSIEDYRDKFRTQLSSEDTGKPKAFAKLEKLSEDPVKFAEWYQGCMYYKKFLSQPAMTEYTDNKDLMLENLDFFEKYWLWKTLERSDEDIYDIGNIKSLNIDNNQIESFLITLNTDKNYQISAWDHSFMKSYFTENHISQRIETEITTSNSVGQNVIYRIAKEIHGYPGPNDMKSLIDYFRSDKANATGMYYDDKWYLNDDWSLDDGIDFRELDQLTLEDATLDTTVEKFVKRHFYTKKRSPGNPHTGTGGETYYVRKNLIDTPTESIDKQLNDELEEKIRAILSDELSYKTDEKKKKIETEIVQYITGATGDGDLYVKLPYDLIIKAKKAGLGNLEYFFFSYKNNKLVVYTSQAYKTENINLKNTVVERMVLENTRKEGFCDEEKQYIDYVESTWKQLTNFLDDDQIPAEYKAMFREKKEKWNQLKISLLGYSNVQVAMNELMVKSHEYHNEFEGMYLILLSKYSSDRDSADDMRVADQELREYLKKGTAVTRNESNGYFEITPKGLFNSDLNTGFRQLTQNYKPFFFSTPDGVNRNTTISELIRPRRKYELEQIIDNPDTLEEDKQKAQEELYLLDKQIKADRPLALRAAKQMLTFLLETRHLHENTNTLAKYLRTDKTENNHPTILRPYGGCKLNKKQYTIISKLEGRLLQKFKNPPNLIELNKFQLDVSSNPSEFKPVDKIENKVSSAVSEVLEVIKLTNSENMVHLDREGIVFDLETNSIQSYGKSTVIDPDKLKISDLDIKFDTMREVVFTANLINRFKKKYAGDQFHYGGRPYAGIYNDSKGGGVFGWRDLRVLSIESIVKNYPQFDSAHEDDREKFIEYLNTNLKQIEVS